MTSDMLPSRFRCAVLAAIYALVLFYASVAIGPSMFQYRPADPWDQWLRLIGVFLAGFVQNGSDQRADWMGNLVAVIPLGFLVAMAMRVNRPLLLRAVMGAFALFLCLIYVVLVKYFQLWFPRTVTLNYITAQSLGMALGVGLVVFGLGTMDVALRRLDRQDSEALLVLAIIASLWAVTFTLSPYDIALSPGDLRERLETVSQSLFALPNSDRADWLRVVLFLAGGLVYAPIGVASWMLARREGWRSDWAALLPLQAGIVLAIWCITLLILSAQPTIWTLFSRIAGCVVGTMIIRAVTLDRLARLRPMLGWPVLWVLYLVALLAVNDLFITHWRTVDEAWDAIDERFFWPLWTHYIVSKAQATRSLAVHVVLYAPIGVMLWAKARESGYGAGRIGLGRQIAALMIGVWVSLAIEIGRWFHPDLKPDFNNAAIAAIAAWGALVLMPHAWAMLRNVARENAAR